eukprot:PITA_17283
MLRMYVMHHQRKWEEYLPLVEFTYNNGYQESLRMSLFEALYEQSCNTPISWSDPVNMVLIGLDMLADMEQEMQVGERVYLCIKPKKSSLRIGSCAKMEPQFCGPFSIIKRIGHVAYRLALTAIVKVHDVFHVSLLKKYVKDDDHVIDWSVLQVEPDGEFQPEPWCIL